MSVQRGANLRASLAWLAVLALCSCVEAQTATQPLSELSPEVRPIATEAITKYRRCIHDRANTITLRPEGDPTEYSRIVVDDCESAARVAAVARTIEWPEQERLSMARAAYDGYIEWGHQAALKDILARSP